MADSEKEVTGEAFEKLEGKYHSAVAELTDVKKKLAKFSDIDPEKYKALTEDYGNIKKELDTMRRQSAGGDQTKIDEYIATKRKELETEYANSYGKKIEGLTSTLAETQKKLNRLEVVTPALKKASELFIPKALPLIERDIESNLRIIDGEIVAVGNDGEVRKSAKDPRQAMGLDEYLDTLADTYDFMRANKQMSGSKGNGERVPGRSTSRGLTVDALSRMSKEQMDDLSMEEIDQMIEHL